MTLSIDDAAMVRDYRLKIVLNMKEGKPAGEGIDENELKKALEVVRSSRSLGAAGSGKKTKKDSAATIPLEGGLDAWMKDSGIKK